ncbi:hypothetical protein IAU60_005965 [Kwoniella sp. DSM 27419]
MTDNDGPGSRVGDMPPPQTSFQTASSFLNTMNAGSLDPPADDRAATPLKQVRQSSSTTTGSMRNAAGGAPPAFDASPAPAPPLAAQAGPSRPINRPAASKNSIVYSAVQRRNPVLASIRNVGIEIGDIVADYQVGAHNGVLFLSLKYHRLHPEYIHQRIEKMKGSYNLRVILVLCDVGEHQQSLRELAKIAIVNEYTVFVAWSNEEVAQYLTCFKAFENKSADTLKERVQQEYHDQLQHVLTSGRKVNKTDADNLAAQFGSFENITKQSGKILSNVKGLGAAKVTSLVDAFTKPFLVGGLRRSQKAVGEPRIVIEKERRAVSGVETTDEDGEPALGSGDAEDADARDGSPDWPDEEDEEEPLAEPSRQRERVPSRSPGLSPQPELGQVTSENAVWQDPLDEDEEAEEETVEPSSKRARVG